MARQNIEAGIADSAAELENDHFDYGHDEPVRGCSACAYLTDRREAHGKLETPVCTNSGQLVLLEAADGRAHCEICTGNVLVTKSGTFRRHRNAKA